MLTHQSPENAQLEIVRKALQACRKRRDKNETHGLDTFRSIVNTSQCGLVKLALAVLRSDGALNRVVEFNTALSVGVTSIGGNSATILLNPPTIR